MDCSLPGSSVHRILQARALEWVAMPSSRDLPNLRIEAVSPASPALQVDSLPLSRLQNPLTHCTWNRKKTLLCHNGPGLPEALLGKRI